nr:unnamed protein product [Digitaria exilis]
MLTDHGASPPCAELPADVLGEIAGLLHDAGDLVRFRAVCRPWREAAPPSRKPTSFLPWLVESWPSPDAPGVLVHSPLSTRKPRHLLMPLSALLYLDYTTKESLKDWQKEWFYAWNHQPQLPSRSGNPPYEARRSLYVSLPPLDPTNTEEAALLARCVDPGVRDQVRQHKQSATEESDELAAHVEQQASEGTHAKAEATSKGGERSKRPAPTEVQAPVPKRARTLPKPRARTIPEERTKIPPQPKTPSSVGISIGEIGTSRSQQGGEEEIIHNIFNPVSAPFVRTIPVVEEPCPAGPSTSEQEAEEEFTLGEPEIPMRPATMEEPPVDHAAVEPEATVPEEPRVMPETTLPVVQTAMPSNLPVPEGAQVEETAAEVLADIEHLVTQAVIEESELERRDQNSAEPPSVIETTQTRPEADEIARGVNRSQGNVQREE